MPTKLCPIEHLKRLGNRGFHDLFNNYLCYFSKHNNYYKTEAYGIFVNFRDFLSDVLLMIFMNINWQWDFIMGRKPIAQL